MRKTGSQACFYERLSGLVLFVVFIVARGGIPQEDEDSVSARYIHSGGGEAGSLQQSLRVVGKT